LSEADFLAQQQTQARAAISDTLADMKHALAQGVNVREWTRQHPWILMGTAAIAGGVVAALLTPSKEESFKEFFEEKWEKFKDKMTPDVSQTATSERISSKPPEEKSSILGSVLKETMKAVGPMLAGLITSMTAQGQDQDHSGNGHNGKPEHENAPHE